MPPPITSASTFETRFGRDLCAADDCNDWLGRRFQRLLKRREFGLHGAPGIGGQLVSEAFGGRMRAVRGRERVVDPDVAELGEFGNEGRIVLLFLFMEAGVFQAQNIAVLHRSHGLGRGLADAVFGEGDRLHDDLRQRFGDGLQRILGIASLRPAEMRKQDDLAALVGNFGDGRRDALKPGRVGDAAVLHGHVEVDAQQYALGLYVDVIEGAEFVHASLSASWPGLSRLPTSCFPREERRGCPAQGRA
jgi:hypothetical protein